jgi:hypothetical protein
MEAADNMKVSPCLANYEFMNFITQNNRPMYEFIAN